jgi:hypothetical protein
LGVTGRPLGCPEGAKQQSHPLFSLKGWNNPAQGNALVVTHKFWLRLGKIQRIGDPDISRMSWQMSRVNGVTDDRTLG